MNLKALNEYSINSHEYGFITEKTHYTSGNYPMYIPKLMPLIGIDKPKQINNIINNNIFINDKECKPVTSTSLTTQNYITPKKFQQADFRFKADIDGYIHQGVKFICLIMDNNPKDIYITNFL